MRETPDKPVPALGQGLDEARMLGALPVADLTVEDPPLEEVLSELFRSSRRAEKVAP